MESALAGIKFFCEQQKLNAQFDHNQLSKKFTRMQSQCKAKLEQVHQGYLQVCKNRFLLLFVTAALAEQQRSAVCTVS
jgi:hypothetical protein